MRKIIFIIIFVFAMVLPVYAHSGRTDENGCHCCYTEECYGEYHCHNNGNKYVPSNGKACPGPNNKTSSKKEVKITESNSKEDDKDNNYVGLALGGLGLYLAGAFSGKRKG